jgi:hypothetical protein
VIDNARNEVRNEEGCGAINPSCRGIACSWSDSRGAAADESPAGCRPDSYRSGTERYFPLMEEEKQFLLTLYPPTWKWRQEKRSRPLFYPSDPK